MCVSAVWARRGSNYRNWLVRSPSSSHSFDQCRARTKHVICILLSNHSDFRHTWQHHRAPLSSIKVNLVIFCIITWCKRIYLQKCSNCTSLMTKSGVLHTDRSLNVIMQKNIQFLIAFDIWLIFFSPIEKTSSTNADKDDGQLFSGEKTHDKSAWCHLKSYISTLENLYFLDLFSNVWF